MLKMYVRLAGLINGLTISDYKESGDGLSFGGYCFDIQIRNVNRKIDFDFPGFAASVQEDGTLLLEAGADTWLGSNDYLDDCYDEEYENLGISRSTLTAAILASTTKIEEFTVNCEGESDLRILSVIFEDDEGMYPVSYAVIDEYNHRISEQAPSEYPYLSKEKLRILDEIEEMRHKATESPASYPLDFVFRACCAIIARCSRPDWTESLKQDPTTAYHKRYYGLEDKRFYC